MDTKERRTFSEEFKREAVRLVETSGLDLSLFNSASSSRLAHFLFEFDW